MDQLLASVGRATTLDDALREIGRWIGDEVFTGRDVRIAFSQKVPEGDSGYLLRQRAVVPPNSSGNPHNYPLSIAAWALLKGRVIAWPSERESPIDIAWLERVRKLGRIKERLFSADMDASPELSRYVDLPEVRTKFLARTLVLGDFYQDGASDQPRTPYLQFLSVPVPMLEQVGNRADPPLGVFNIDCRDRGPLLDRRVNELLRLASVVTVLAFRLFPDAISFSMNPDVGSATIASASSMTRKSHVADFFPGVAAESEMPPCLRRMSDERRGCHRPWMDEY